MSARWVKTVTVLAAFSIVAAVHVPAAGAAVPKPDPNATVRLAGGASTAVSGWDANKYTGGNAYINMLMAVYDRLLQLSNDSKELKPMLATSWKWDATNTKLTMPLRKDVKFQDGSPFNAAVAVANIKRTAEKDGVSATQLATMTSVAALDDSTIQLTFSQPNPAVVYTFSNFGGMMVSGNAIASPATIAALKTAPAGSGPFKYAETTGDLTVKLDRYDGYWDKSRAYPAHYQQLSILDENTRLNAIKTGAADMASLLTYDLSKKDPSVQVYSTPGSAPYVLFMNTKIAPLDNLNVRKAIDMTLNRPAFEASQNGGCTATYQQFPPGVDGYINGLKPTKPNITAAKKLVQDAGANGAKFSVIMYNIEPYQTYAKIVQAQLGAIGLNVELVSIAASVGKATYRTGQYAALVGTMVPGAFNEPSFYMDLYTLGIENPGNKDPNLQAMADKAKPLSLGTKERTTAYQDINKYMMDNPIWAPICNPINVWVGSNNVIGLDQMPGSRLIVTPNSYTLNIAKSK